MFQAIVIATHAYKPKASGESGCAVCGFGPGSLEHNTSQPQWTAWRDQALYADRGLRPLAPSRASLQESQVQLRNL
jgi:hypothetical protein